MRTLIQAIAVSGAVAAPALAQDAPQDASQGAGARLDAMTCSEFLQFGAQDQMTVMLAMRAHYNGEPLPDEPLPIGVEAEASADGLGGDSGEASAEGLDASLEGGAEGAGSAAAAMADTGGAGAAADGAATGEGAGGTDVPDETGIVDGENESGQVNPDGTEASVTDAPADPKLTAMRTSCEGGPEALALDAMRAAHADYE
jgi:hypothetical protein